MRVHPRFKQAGFTLVELMVALVIGLVVVGAVLSTYLASSRGGRAGAAMGQITEDATAALTILRQQISLAGYNTPAGDVAGGNGFIPTYAGAGVRGCDVTFTNTGTPTLAALNCPAGAAGPDSLAVAYQADLSNTVPTVAAGGVGPLPSDCLGNGLVQVPLAGTTPAHFRAENRFFVANGTLSCIGNGGTGPVDPAFAATSQPLVDNVVDLRFSYGVGADDDGDGRLDRVADYVDANTVQVAGNWPVVLAVRVCVVVRSAEPVLDQRTPYLDCNLTITTPTDANDRRLYRSFTTTVMMNNRSM